MEWSFTECPHLLLPHEGPIPPPIALTWQALITPFFKRMDLLFLLHMHMNFHLAMHCLHIFIWGSILCMFGEARDKLVEQSLPNKERCEEKREANKKRRGGQKRFLSALWVGQERKGKCVVKGGGMANQNWKEEKKIDVVVPKKVYHQRYLM